MNILFVSSEATPFAKSGGLGDVIGTLPSELVKRGISAGIMIPLYKSIKEKYASSLVLLETFNVQLAWRNQYCGLYTIRESGVDYYFIDNEQYFKRDRYYGYYDDGERFAYFSKAAIEAVKHIEKKPDIIHCSDWQTALIPIYLRTLYEQDAYLRDIKTVFSIHNIEYQGRFNPYITGDILGLSQEDEKLMIDGDSINLMKGAIKTSDALTTVSRSYAYELCDPFFAAGLQDTIARYSFKLRGIINGIDTSQYDPQTDKNLRYSFSAEKMEGKLKNKEALQEELGLEVNREVPVISMITRLVSHKGVDLVQKVYDEIMALGVQLIILGTGDREYEEFFSWKASQYEGRAVMLNCFSSELASRIYASSDMFLMPSKSEPCGLAQMIASRYGTVPIVREAGGLRDSIEPFNPVSRKGNGITFRSFDAYDMLDAIKRALEIYSDHRLWKHLTANAMKKDFSWDGPVEEYMDLYKELEKKYEQETEV